MGSFRLADSSRLFEEGLPDLVGTHPSYGDSLLTARGSRSQLDRRTRDGEVRREEANQFFVGGTVDRRCLHSNLYRFTVPPSDLCFRCAGLHMNPDCVAGRSRSVRGRLVFIRPGSPLVSRRHLNNKAHEDLNDEPGRNWGYVDRPERRNNFSEWFYDPVG